MAILRNDIDGRLEIAFQEVIQAVNSGDSFANDIDKNVRTRIDTWEYGKYGWTSPVNLLITAAWYKWLNPQQDVCIIWSLDANRNAIHGGFSIRSEDERHTVQLVSKHHLYPGFCSRNSGMQGTRALEKSRLRDAHERIDRDSDLGQRVSWNLALFRNILNDINDASSAEAKSIFQYYLEIAFKLKARRIAAISEMPTTVDVTPRKTHEIVLNAVNEIVDPQFVRAVVLGILEQSACIYSPVLPDNVVIQGGLGAKTGADARARTPGDIWVEVNGVSTTAIEVKDKSHTFDFSILAAVRDRYTHNPTLIRYLLVTAADTAVTSTVLADPEWTATIMNLEQQGLEVIAVTLRQFMRSVHLVSSLDSVLLASITRTLAEMPDLKRGTIANWSKRLKDS